MNCDFDDNVRMSASRRKEFLMKEFLNRMADNGLIPLPVPPCGKKIASSFWGASWCRNVETYHDYESRLPLGRTLVRKGAVADLRETDGVIHAVVLDSEIFDITLQMEPMIPEMFQSLKCRCTGKLSSLTDLLQGDFSPELMSIIGNPENGLFPAYDELHVSCNCFDDSILCKHAAAVLYGLGIRFDSDPALFFRLRGLSAADFFTADDSVSALADHAEKEEISEDDLSDMFGIDIG